MKLKKLKHGFWKVVILSSNDLNNVFCQDQIVTFSANGATNYEFFVASTSQGSPSIIDTLNSSSFGIGILLA